MDKRAIDFFKLLLPLNSKRRTALKIIEKSVSKRELADIKYYLKIGQLGLYNKSLVLKKFFGYLEWPQLILAKKNYKLQKLLEKVNERVENDYFAKQFKSFAKEDVIGKISKYVAPGIIGADIVKKAVASQLFAKEPIHILLLGDPGTGKTDIIRDAAEMSPISSFGLGSGTTGAGLTVTKNTNFKLNLKKKKTVKENDSEIDEFEEETEFNLGLLPQANGGLCCIDELNLMQSKDKAGLYSAMEKGFITYDKGGKHETFDAKVKVLATANPQGDKFIGKNLDFLKKQIPFKQALLSRFHLLFIFRKPSEKELINITRKIVNDKKEDNNDIHEFIQLYVNHASLLEVSFDKKLEPMVVNFIEDIKGDEKHFLTEIGPRTVIGIMRFAKAFARAKLKRHVTAEELEAAMKLMKEALYFQKKDKKKKKK